MPAKFCSGNQRCSNHQDQPAPDNTETECKEFVIIGKSLGFSTLVHRFVVIISVFPNLIIVQPKLSMQSRFLIIRSSFHSALSCNHTISHLFLNCHKQTHGHTKKCTDSWVCFEDQERIEFIYHKNAS